MAKINIFEKKIQSEWNSGVQATVCIVLIKQGALWTQSQVFPHNKNFQARLAVCSSEAQAVGACLP